MGEKFQGWLNDRDHLQVLEGYGLDKISGDLQTTLEELCATPYAPSTSGKRDALAGKIAGGLGLKKDFVINGAKTLSALDEGVRTYKGTDPQVFEDGGHYRGNS